MPDSEYQRLDAADEWPEAGFTERLTAYIDWFGNGIIAEQFDSEQDYIDGKSDSVVHSRDIEALINENASFRGEVASRDADIIGQQNIITMLQKRLREAEDEASAKKAAARQAEEVRTVHGLMTTAVPPTEEPPL